MDDNHAKTLENSYVTYTVYEYMFIHVTILKSCKKNKTICVSFFNYFEEKLVLLINSIRHGDAIIIGTEIWHVVIKNAKFCNTTVE